MDCQQLSLNPSSHKSRCTRGFLRALLRINKNRPTSSSPKEICRRSRRIKSAAYVSMAYAVGPRRAWSRAVLSKVRKQAKDRALFRKVGYGAKRKRHDIGNEPVREGADNLRRLVPGCETMGFCSLLDETAHFIKCLSTQERNQHDQGGKTMQAKEQMWKTLEEKGLKMRPFGRNPRGLKITQFPVHQHIGELDVKERIIKRWSSNQVTKQHVERMKQ
ncbi:hypothetical protein HHK36_020136 [Tetracentron sinense]|uniref:IBH1-like N-terminal domain-containing protein n=1 Tax=Tetracentron sinense TaxID=13715 RepID=A0A835DBC5_TETSI|nr:hypothetical protein HHK36_020136 [Tetracentron sinense]